MASAGAAILAVAALVGGKAISQSANDVQVAPADDGPLTLHADKSRRVLTASVGGETVATYDIAVGEGGYPTPSGEFSIRKLIWNPGWIPPNREWARDKVPQAPGSPNNPMRVVKIFFLEPAYYIHGTNDVGSLGHAASHGCIRMAPGDAAELARMIMAHGGANRGDDWFERIRDGGDSQSVYLSDPIPLTISD
jgi:lipoprotein-anchoring transpeptidase ErfK/SrfK